MSLANKKRTKKEVFKMTEFRGFWLDQGLDIFKYEEHYEIKHFSMKDSIIYIDIEKEGRPYRYIVEGKWVVKEEEIHEE